MVFGADIDPTAKQEFAAELVAQGVPSENLVLGDFLSLAPERDLPRVHAVIGNPPYVRHHWIDNDTRLHADRIAAKTERQIDGRSSLWAYFVLHATAFLERGGRMAMLLPGSAIQAKYASGVRLFLEDNFSSVQFVRVAERIFSDTDEETVVLLASGYGGRSQGAHYRHVPGLTELEEAVAQSASESPLSETPVALSESRWLSLGEEARQIYAALASNPATTPLGNLVKIRIGTVTGANTFFIRTDMDARALVGENQSRRILTRNNHIQGPILTTAEFERATEGRPNRLLVLPPNFLPMANTAIEQEIARGEISSLHLRSHCSRRSPWWALPEPRAPHAFLPYMGSSAKGIALNEARVASTNAVHQLTWLSWDIQRRGKLIAQSSWSVFTAIAFELHARSYGGGLLKIEPSDAAHVPIFIPEGAASMDPTSETPRQAADMLLRRHAGLTASELAVLEHALGELQAMRRGTSRKLQN